MKLSKYQLRSLVINWMETWNLHDLDGIMGLFHEDGSFENWTTGSIRGKERLRQAWEPWFAEDKDFIFTIEDLFVDEDEQKVVCQWKLEWPSREGPFRGKREMRRGVDVIHFNDGKIILKCTYSKTTIEINGCSVKLTASID